jgi:TP901 family phage tail tape measure protein
MANVVGRIPVGADTRPLENDISAALSKNYQLKGLNDKAFSQPLGRITGAVDEFRKSLDASNARVLAFGASAGAIFAVQKGFENLIKTTINVQKNLTDINSILGLSSKNLTIFGDQLFKVAGQTGQSFEAVSQAAVEFSRQGLGVEETLKRTRDALILTRLSGLDVVSSTQALTATINSFNKVALDSTQIVNKLATVDAAFAVSSGDLAEAISRVGSSADSVGVNLDQLVALVTSVQQTTARGGAVIGNSLKTIFTRLERTEVLDQLEALGIQARNLDGSFRPAIDTLSQLATTFDGLSDSQRANVAELVGGVFQINILKAALGDLGKQYSIYNSALNTSTGATDAAIKRNEQLNQTLSALINKTTTNFTKLAADVGGLTLAPAIEGVLGNINSALESFNLADAKGPGEKLAKGLLEGLGNYISGPGLALIGAVIGKLFINLAKFSGQAVGQILEINKSSQQQAEIQQRINSILSQNPNLIQGILNKEISLLSVENDILKVIQAQTVAREQSARISNTIAGSLISRGVTSTGGKISAKSGGFIPNFSSAEQAEVYGAYLGGYKPGAVSSMNIPGAGSVVYNKAEQVKQFPGMSQPAIMPPQGSSAGKNYSQAFQSKLGFNPYAAMGYVPNFASIDSKRINSIATQLAKGKMDQIPPYVNEKDVNKIYQRVEQIKNKPGTPVTKEILDASGIATMLVPHGGMTSPFGQYSYENGVTVKWPVRSYGSRSETGIRDIYQEIEKGVATGTKKYAASIQPPAKEPDGQRVISAIKRTPGAAGALGAAAGAAFEVGMGIALGAESAAVEGVNFDVLSSNPELKKLFGYNTPLADFKINDSSASNRKSMADKIITASGFLGKQTFSGNEKNLMDRQASVKQFVKNNNLNKSSGFVPNFSALAESMRREISAGISPSSIRVGQDSRLSHAENPMGLGVYNTKDEPAGLGQGIGRFKNLFNARKAGASKGFIPNYAPLNKYQKINYDPNAPSSQGLKTPFGQGGGALAASILAPMIGGAVSSGMSEDNVVGRGIAGGLGNVASYAATGAAVGGGLPGAVIGGAFGIATTLLSIQKELDEKPFKMLEKSIQLSQEKLNSLNDSFSKFNSISEKLNNAYVGNIQLSSKELDKLQTAQVATLASLPEETRNSILEALGKGDTLQVQMIQAEVLEAQQSKVQAFEAASTDAALKVKQKSGYLDIANAIGTNLSNFGNINTMLNPISYPQDMRDQYLKQNPLELEKEKNARQKELDRFGNLNLENNQTVGQTIQKSSTEGMSNEQIRAKLMESETIKKYRLQSYVKDFDIQKFKDTTKKANEANLIVQVNSAKVRDSAQKFLSALEENIATTNREFSESETKITNTISVLQSRRGILLESIKNLFGEFTQLDVSKQYDDAIRANEYQKSKLQIRNKLSTQTSTLGGGAVEAFRTSPSPDTSLIKFINGIGADIESLKGISDPGKLKAESMRLANVYSEKASGGINGLVDDKAKSAAAAFADQLRNLGKSSDDLDNQMNALNSTYETSTQIAKEENQARLQSLRLQQSLAFGGGINSLKSNDSRSRINSFNQNRFLMGSDNPTTSGRGALGAFQELQQFGIGPQSVNEDLKNKIVGGQAANLQKLASGFGIEINKQQALDIATKQFESISKTDANVEIIKTAVESISNNGIKIANPSQPGATQGSGNESGGVPLFKSKEANQDYLNTINSLQADASSQKMEQVFRQAITGQTGDMNIGKIKVSPQRSTSELIKDQVKAIQEKYAGEQAVLDLLNQSTSEYEKLLTSSIDYNTGLQTSVQYISDIDSILQQVNDGEMNVLDARQKINVLLENGNTKIERSNKFITDQIEHTRDLKDLADGYLTSVEYASKELERQQNLARRGGYNPAIGIATNFVNEMSYNGTQFFQDLNTSAVSVAQNIQESFSNAFQSFASGTVSAGDAFKNFAIQILQQIQQISTQISTKLFMGAIFNQFQGAMGGGSGGLGSLLGFSQGGLVKKYASGGYVTGGSGMTDDVPAALSKGEYVLNQRAVRSIQQNYGSGFLHSLNSGSVRGMADGGGFSKNFNNEFAVSGIENTSGLDTKNMESGLRSLDTYINQLKGENNVDPALSNYALSDADSIKNQERMQKQVDYKDYVGYLMDSYNQNTATMVSAQQAYAKELDAYNQQQKQMLQSAWMSAAMAVGSAGINFAGGMGSFGGGASQYAMPGGMGGTSSALGGSYGSITSLYGGAQKAGGFSSLFSSQNLPMLGILGAGVVGSPFLQNMLKGNGTSYASSSGRTSSGLTTSNRFRFASGGAAQDDIPALLMGGEFVVNKNAVKKYGTGFFEKLNNGRVKGFADGGQVGSSVLGGNAESTLNVDVLTKAIADLNETIKNQKDMQSTSAGDTNNITIQISMDANGKTTENSQDNSTSPNTDNNENKNSDRAAREKDMKDFTQLIKQNVLSTIIDQKRPGGLLSKTSQS